MKKLIKGDKVRRINSNFNGYRLIEKGEVYTFHSYDNTNVKAQEIFIEEYPEHSLQDSNFEKVETGLEDLSKKDMFKVGDQVKVLDGKYGSHRIGEIGTFIETQSDGVHVVRFTNSKTVISNIKLVEEPKTSPCTHQDIIEKAKIEKEIVEEVRKGFKTEIDLGFETPLSEATKHDQGKVSREFESGMKRDSDETKPYVHNLQGYTRLRFGYLTRMGAKNYGDGNFLKGSPSDDALKSLDRHLAKFMDGDRSEDHLAAIIFNTQLIMLNEKREGIKADHYFKN